MSSTTVKVLKWAGRKAVSAAVAKVSPGSEGTCPAHPKRAGKRCGRPVRNSNSRGRAGKSDNLTCGHQDCATWYAIHIMDL